METIIAAIIAGFFSVILSLMGGLAYLTRQRAEDREEEQHRWADLCLRLGALEEKIDEEHLLHGPHMSAHETIDKTLDDHGARLKKIEKLISRYTVN